MKKMSNITKLLSLVIGLIIFNVLAQYIYGSLDLTEDKKFTLTKSTSEIIKNIDEQLDIKILLTGDFPAGVERLEQSTKELLDDLRDINPNIQYDYEDINQGTQEEKIIKAEALAKQGIIPTNLNHYNGEEYVQKAIYPYAIISYKGRMLPVNLLEEQSLGIDEDIVLNKSVEQLEYKFANAINKLSYNKPKHITFLSGHNELPLKNTYALQSELARHYSMSRLNLDTIRHITNTDLLIIAGPKQPYSDSDKLKIDQFIMNGGRTLWLLDKLDVTLDSIGIHNEYIPNIQDLNLDDLLFKYGVRIQPNLVMDLQSSKIPQIVGQQGGRPQTQLFPWVYHPVATPNSNHLITKNTDGVNMFFPSSIDTVKTRNKTHKEILLSTSEYSRYQLSPMRLTFEILKYQPNPNMFNKGNLPLAVLLEGSFSSLYKNRFTESLKKDLGNINFVEESKNNKLIVVSDSDFISNSIETKSGKARPLGMNKWDRQLYNGNKTFILNAIEYLLDDANVLESRGKEVKLRLLNKVKTRKEATKWQIINIVFPLFVIIMFGIIFNYIRRRKYT